MEHVYVDTDYDHDFDNTKKYIATQTKRCRKYVGNPDMNYLP